MDMEKTLQELDRLFATYQMDKAEGFLENKMAEALLAGRLPGRLEYLFHYAQKPVYDVDGADAAELYQ